MADGESADGLVGSLVGPVRVGRIAHGGHCVARHDGRVIFVRHALPDELVVVSITDAGHDRFWRGDAVEILEPSADRAEPTCPVAGPGGCGGCDFQHVTTAGQRRLKAAVVAEQLRRLAGLDLTVEVAEVSHPAVHRGRGWRTRMHWVADADGRAGLRRHRSHELVVPEPGCELAHADVPEPVGSGPWRPGTSVLGVAGAESAALLADGKPILGPAELLERADGHTYRVDAAGFWQVHPAAADTLATAVVSAVEPCPGERAFDLYCGVGLFAGALARRGVRVWGVEADPRAIRHARRNVVGVTGPDGRVGAGVRFTVGRVERALRTLPRRTDVIVLDPPRTGAGGAVMRAVTAREARVIVYVACDPAALARDTAALQGAGYRLIGLRAFDCFPQTHHVEAVAVFCPEDDTDSGLN